MINKETVVLFVSQLILLNYWCSAADNSTQLPPCEERPKESIPEEPWLEQHVIGVFKVWHIIFSGLFSGLAIVIVLCCLFRCRIPRTKQEIEADAIRKKITKVFRNHLNKIKVEELDAQTNNLVPVLQRVEKLEVTRMSKQVSFEAGKPTWRQKLRAIFAMEREMTNSSSIDDTDVSAKYDSNEGLTQEEKETKKQKEEVKKAEDDHKMKEVSKTVENAKIDTNAFNVISDHFTILMGFESEKDRKKRENIEKKEKLKQQKQKEIEEKLEKKEREKAQRFEKKRKEIEDKLIKEESKIKAKKDKILGKENPSQKSFQQVSIEVNGGTIDDIDVNHIEVKDSKDDKHLEETVVEVNEENETLKPKDKKLKEKEEKKLKEKERKEKEREEKRLREENKKREKEQKKEAEERAKKEREDNRLRHKQEKDNKTKAKDDKSEDKEKDRKDHKISDNEVKDETQALDEKIIENIENDRKTVEDDLQLIESKNETQIKICDESDTKPKDRPKDKSKDRDKRDKSKDRDRSKSKEKEESKHISKHRDDHKSKSEEKKESKTEVENSLKSKEEKESKIKENEKKEFKTKVENFLKSKEEKESKNKREKELKPKEVKDSLNKRQNISKSKEVVREEKDPKKSTEKTEKKPKESEEKRDKSRDELRYKSDKHRDRDPKSKSKERDEKRHKSKDRQNVRKLIKQNRSEEIIEIETHSRGMSHIESFRSLRESDVPYIKSSDEQIIDIENIDKQSIGTTTTTSTSTGLSGVQRMSREEKTKKLVDIQRSKSRESAKSDIKIEIEDEFGNDLSERNKNDAISGLTDDYHNS